MHEGAGQKRDGFDGSDHVGEFITGNADYRRGSHATAPRWPLQLGLAIEIPVPGKGDTIRERTSRFIESLID